MDIEMEGGGASRPMSTHTSGRMSTRIEVVAGRRRWTVEQKLAILRDAFGPEGSVGDACKRHAIGSGSIYTWRRQAMSGEFGGVRAPALPSFAQVELSVPVAAVPASGGQIGIELPTGVKLTVDAGVDGDALARVISVLTR